MNWLDFLLIALLLLAAYAGWCLRGLMLLKVLLCVALAPWFGEQCQHWLGARLDAKVHEWVRGETLAFWLGLLAGVALLLLAFKLITNLVEKLKLVFADRTLGAGLLALCGWLLLMVLFLDVVPKNPAANTQKVLQHSWLCRQAFPKSNRFYPAWREDLLKLGQALHIPMSNQPSPAPAGLKHNRQKHLV